VESHGLIDNTLASKGSITVQQNTRPTPSGKRVQLSLVANPSHLEAEDPVVLGKTRAIQHKVDGTTGRVGRKRVESHGLIDNTLASKGSITVQQLLFRHCQVHRRSRLPRERRRC
jgi:hypothetical protein